MDPASRVWGRVVCGQCNEIVSTKPGSHTAEACREKQWRRLCAPAMLDTDAAKVPNPTQTQAALEWTYKPGGLALIGETRSGKTRTAYLICRREFMAGKSVALFPCGEFSWKCSNAFGGRMTNADGDTISGAEWMEGLSRKSLLLLDDLDKVKLTERVESELFSLLDARMMRLVPTIITTNYTGRELAARFVDKVRGRALVARIREAYTAIAF